MQAKARLALAGTMQVLGSEARPLGDLNFPSNATFQSRENKTCNTFNVMLRVPYKK